MLQRKGQQQQILKYKKERKAVFPFVSTALHCTVYPGGLSNIDGA